MLIIIATDPRESHRPAEAVRVAAGLAALGSLPIEVCFCQSATLLLGKTSFRFVDEEILKQHLPLLSKYARRIMAESGDPFLSQEAQVPYERIGLTELSALAAQHEQVIRF